MRRETTQIITKNILKTYFNPHHVPKQRKKIPLTARNFYFRLYTFYFLSSYLISARSFFFYGRGIFKLYSLMRGRHVLLAEIHALNISCNTHMLFTLFVREQISSAEIYFHNISCNFLYLSSGIRRLFYNLSR